MTRIHEYHPTLGADPTRACVCPPSAIARYRRRLSGPLLDRVDSRSEVPRVEYAKLEGPTARRPAKTLSPPGAVSGPASASFPLGAIETVGAIGAPAYSRQVEYEQCHEHAESDQKEFHFS
jgi:hypothetical protein